MVVCFLGFSGSIPFPHLDLAFLFPCSIWNLLILKTYSLFTWNVNLTGQPVFLFVKSGYPSCKYFSCTLVLLSSCSAAVTWRFVEDERLCWCCHCHLQGIQHVVFKCDLLSFLLSPLILFSLLSHIYISSDNSCSKLSVSFSIVFIAFI